MSAPRSSSPTCATARSCHSIACRERGACRRLTYVAEDHERLRGCDGAVSCLLLAQRRTPSLRLARSATRRDRLDAQRVDEAVAIVVGEVDDLADRDLAVGLSQA